MRAQSLLALTLFALSASASAQQVDRSPYWLYVSLATPLIAQLEAHPELRGPGGPFEFVEIQFVSKMPSDVTGGTINLKSLTARARAAGIPSMPSFRLWPMNPLPADGWLNKAIWIQHAAHLRSIVAALELRPGARVAFDQEPYAAAVTGAMPMPTLAAFKEAAAPFLTAISETGIVPCVLDARIDYVSTQAIVDAAFGSAEIWVENGFTLPTFWFLDPARAQALVLSMHQDMARMERAYGPKVSAIRSAVNEDILRAWGSGLRAAQVSEDGPVLGAWRPWIFHNQRLDETVIGSPEWFSGAKLSSSNDVKDVWYGSVLSTGNVAPLVGSKMLTATKLPGTWPSAGADLRSTQGYLLTGGVYLRGADVMTKGVGFNVAAEVVLPLSGGCVVVGGNQTNSESWQVRVDPETDAMQLELRTQAPGGKETFVFLDHPPRGVPIRVLVSNEGSAWKLQRDKTFAPVKPMNPHSGHLSFGAGTKVTTYEPLFCEGGRFREGERLPERALTLVERDAILAKGYPRP